MKHSVSFEPLEATASQASQTKRGVKTPATLTGALLFGKLLRPAKHPGELGRLANFSITRLIGQGGMGVVFEAVDELLKRSVALKVLQPEIQSDTKARTRFLEEARACAALRHDNIVPLYQVAEDNNVIFLAMPLLQGKSLDRWSRQQPAAHFMQVLRIGRDVADGLAAAHAQGIIHRDIKLANIWLEAPKGRAVILDFGLAGKVESFDNEQKRKECVGTTGYIAPEQVNGAACDHRVGLFSLGVVLYKLATGQMPYPGSESFVLYYEALNNHQPEPPHVLNPTMPESLSKLILSLLANMPQQRPESARQVRALLQQIQDDEVQKEVDKSGSAGELLKQGIIAFQDDGTLGAAEQSTSLTSYFVAKSKSRFPLPTLALALILGCMLAMGLWIYDSERDSERPVLTSTSPVLRHYDVRSKVKHTGTVSAPAINEASALIKSSKHPGIFYTLCDANNPNHVFAIDEKGKLHATLQLVGVQNFDWEALTSDGAGNLYVGDTGNNLLRFRERTIYRIAEPEQLPKESHQTPSKVSITGTRKYSFPLKPFDAESLLLDDEYFWIISKARNLSDARLYRLPRSAEGKTTPLEEIGKLPNEMVMISDAALSPDRKQLVVVNKFYAAFFPLPNGKVAEAVTAEPTYYEFDLNKVEGCCFDGEDLLMIAEDRKIYRLPR